MAVSFISGENRSTRRKPKTCCKSLTNFITLCCIENTSPWMGLELITLVVIDTDYTGSCKSNYHTISSTTSPNVIWYYMSMYMLSIVYKYIFSINSLTSWFDLIWFDLLCLTPLSAIFQLNHRDQKKPEYPERTTDHEQATGKLYHLRLRIECTFFVIYKVGREPTPYWW